MGIAGVTDEDVAAIWNDAVGHHTAGRLPQAEALYRRILASDARHASALHLLGTLQFQLGRGQDGLEMIDQAIAFGGETAARYGHRGLILASLGRHDEAIAAYRRALSLEPGRADTLNNLGSALRAVGDLPGAIAAYREALAADPTMEQTSVNLGLTLLTSGAFEEAVETFTGVHHRHPEDAAARNHLATAYNNIGAERLRRGEAAGALEALYESLALQPELFEARLNAGKALAELNRNDEAIPSFRHALALQPESGEAYNDLGNALYRCGQVDEAIASYCESLRLQPESARAYNNLGNAFRVRGRLNESVTAYRCAIEIEPEDAEVWNNLGSVLAARGDIEAAIESLEKAIRLQPDLSEAHNNLGNTYKDQADLDAAIACYDRAIAACPSNQDAHSNRLYTLYFHPERSLREIYEEHTHWNAQYAENLYPTTPTFPNDRTTGRRLRIGYVAPFFREHCQSLFTLPLLSHHDQREVELFLYSDVAAPDAITARIRGLCDGWRSIAGLSHESAADLIRQDSIDILVDLSLHMAGNRLLMFAQRPAPVQVTWLGYPGTTGLKAIDYRLTDPYLDPPDGANDALYAERSLRLPNTFWCYDPLDTETRVSDLPAARRGYVTFGCLNNFCKINRRTLELWATVLRAVPHSRLRLLAPEGRGREWVCAEMREGGVDSARIEFAHWLPRRDYLAQYHHIDIGLDTIPYNGHTTSLDSFWMGVPVVTRVTDAPVGRAGWSQLSNLGLTHLAAESDDEFVRLATELSANASALASLRAELRERFVQSPLCDAKRFATDIEAAYRQIWATYCDS